MFTKQVSRSGGGLDPHRGRRGGAGRANSKKDLVMGPIEVFVPYRRSLVSSYASESNPSDIGSLLPGSELFARNPDAIATPARTVSADCVPMSNQLLVVTNH